MEINDKKFTRTRKVINFLISFVLAIFLILLSNTIVEDLDNTVARPTYRDFVDSNQQSQFNAEKKANEGKITALVEARSNIRKMIDTAENNKNAEQQSFDNWIKTRSTLGSAEQDPEVMKRLRKLDEYKQIVQSWELQSDSISNCIIPLESRNSEIYEEEDEVRQESQKLYESQMNHYDLKVFLVRLLFVAPILILGIYLFVRKRNSKLSPLYMGVSLFSVYLFFVGLVPYLPSYGGYIRYTVGVLLTVGLGYYAIQRLKAYQERKSAELKASSEVRASKLQNETSERAFNNHVCPSCGKDFLLKNWETLSGVNLQNMRPLLGSHYCRYCGLQLVKECSNCQQKNYAHLPFCINCGDRL